MSDGAWIEWPYSESEFILTKRRLIDAQDHYEVCSNPYCPAKILLQQHVTAEEARQDLARLWIARGGKTHSTT